MSRRTAGRATLVAALVSMALGACGGSGHSAKSWAASACKTTAPDWDRAKADYKTMMAGFEDPAKPIGNLTWSTVGTAFTTAENDLNALSDDAPNNNASQALSGAADGASSLALDTDSWAAGLLPPSQAVSGSPGAAISTISSVITTDCG